MKTLGTVLAICLLLSVGIAQSAVPKAEQEKRFAPLATVDFGDVYSDDGAADGTVTYRGVLASYSVQGRSRLTRSRSCSGRTKLLGVPSNF